MNLYKARTLTEKLADKYLFTKQLEFAGYADDEDELADERIVELFKSIMAIGIGRSSSDEYFLRLYHSAPLRNTHLIAEEFQIDERDVVFQFNKPFSIQPNNHLGKIVAIWLSKLNNKKKRPVTMGCSVGHLLSKEFGSVGCFVRGADGKNYLLSNRHVLFNENTQRADDFIVQPAMPHGGGKKEIVGLFHASLPFNADDINEYDAALAGPLSCDISCEIPLGNEEKRYLRNYSQADNDMRVYKCGFASKISYGVLTDVGVAVEVNFHGKTVLFKNLLLIKGSDAQFETPRTFSRPGDSGSVVITFDDDEAIGLLFAGSGSGTSLACPIDEILNKLNVSLF